MINYKELRRQLRRGITKLTDFEKITQIYREAEKGILEAQYSLGLLYHLGHGFEKDEGEAIRWWTEAAKQGHAECQFNVGWLYCISVSLFDFEKAMKWFKKAAAQGMGEASYWIGKLYYEGNGVRMDKREAMKWFKKGNAHGSVDASYAIRKIKGGASRWPKL